MCFVLISVSYMTMYVPIVMYGLRLFIVVLQCLPNICGYLSVQKISCLNSEIRIVVHIHSIMKSPSLCGRNYYRKYYFSSVVPLSQTY